AARGRLPRRFAAGQAAADHRDGFVTYAHPPYLVRRKMKFTESAEFIESSESTESRMISVTRRT
ncbi:MAG TPA: hypothetical protein VGC61_04655, partial [Pyrinomonadaceae bacterium]